MIITVFGASLTYPGLPLYDDAMLLGKLLAQSGYTVMTGGYIGAMEAVSRGAAEAGGHVIGATCAEIEQWRKVGANQWVIEEHKSPSLIERLDTLISRCDAALALPGGVGTLAEILVTWNRIIIQSIPPRPLILIGDEWKQTMTAFINNQGNFISEKDRAWVGYANDVTTAVDLLKASLNKK
jgi:uncharacterized protein (TIGR00730 family)